MKTFARLLVALVMAVSLGGGVSLQSASAVGHAAAPDPHAKTKVCERNRQYFELLRAKGISCRRAKQIRYEAMGRWPWAENRTIAVQNFRCRNHNEYAPDIVCRGKKAPRQRWMTWVSE